LLKLVPQAGDIDAGNAFAQERKSLLKIVGALTSICFGKDIHSQPHTMATELREEITKLGLNISQVTVANKLREAMEVVAVSLAANAKALALVPSPPAERKDYLQRLIDAAEDAAA